MAAFVDTGRRAGAVAPQAEVEEVVGAEAKVAKERTKEVADKSRAQRNIGKGIRGGGLRSLLGSGGFRGIGSKTSFFRQDQWKPK